MAASIASEFYIDGMPGHLLLQSCDYRFTQPTDVKGRPATGVRSGLINVVLLGDDHAVLTNWAAAYLKDKNGRIVFKDIDGLELKTLHFYDAHCVRYSESFGTGSSVAAYRFSIGISARLLQLDSHLHDNLWTNHLRHD